MLSIVQLSRFCAAPCCISRNSFNRLPHLLSLVNNFLQLFFAVFFQNSLSSDSLSRLPHLSFPVNTYFYFFHVISARYLFCILRHPIWHLQEWTVTWYFSHKSCLAMSRQLCAQRRRRDLNPRAAINDLLPFQGSPFGQLGYFSMTARYFELD